MAGFALFWPDHDDATFSFLEDAYAYASSTVVATLTIAACSAVLTELASSGLLDSVYITNHGSRGAHTDCSGTRRRN